MLSFLPVPPIASLSRCPLLTPIKLLQRTDCDVVGAAFVIDLPDLGGAKRIEALGVPVTALVEFAGH